MAAGAVPVASALPERLREATRELHTATERSGAMAALLAGRLPRAGYCAMLRNLHALYAALEAALAAHAAEPALVTLAAGPLQRAPVLAEDLVVMHGPGWAETLPLAAAMQAYVARLQALQAAPAAEAAPGLVAHAYVRYLGDLHGGQVLQRLVARLYALPAGDSAAGSPGTSFYDFGDTPQVLLLRQQLRRALGSLPFDAAQQDATVAEALWAFTQHRVLFEELAAAPAAV
jgi:heme oxygenase